MLTTKNESIYNGGNDTIEHSNIAADNTGNSYRKTREIKIKQINNYIQTDKEHKRER